MGERLSGYRAALDYLFERTTGGSRFGLERTEALLHALGDPHDRLRILHVAGTNGKGSACATLEAVLRHRGLRVGKYTSPHLVDFRERFLVDGRAVEAIRREERGQIVVGVMPGLSGPFMRRALTEFRRHHPDVAI